MMPVELNGNLLKELRGRTCRILADEGWTQSNLGNALGVSQVMAGNYLHTLPKRYSEPTEGNLQEASVSLADIIRSNQSAKWSLSISVNDQVITINFPSKDSKEKILEKLSKMRRRLESQISLLSPQVRVNIAISSIDAKGISDIAAFPGRLTPIGGKARPLSSPRFGASNHLADLLLELRKYIINLRWDPIISESLDRLGFELVKLKRDNEDLQINSKITDLNIMVDEGGHGFEPSLYIYGSDSEIVCEIIEKISSEMKEMA